MVNRFLGSDVTVQAGLLGDGQRLFPYGFRKDGTTHPSNHGLCSVITR